MPRAHLVGSDAPRHPLKMGEICEQVSRRELRVCGKHEKTGSLVSNLGNLKLNQEPFSKPQKGRDAGAARAGGARRPQGRSRTGGSATTPCPGSGPAPGHRGCGHQAAQLCVPSGMGPGTPGDTCTSYPPTIPQAGAGGAEMPGSPQLAPLSPPRSPQSLGQPLPRSLSGFQRAAPQTN